MGTFTKASLLLCYLFCTHKIYGQDPSNVLTTYEVGEVYTFADTEYIQSTYPTQTTIAKDGIVTLESRSTSLEVTVISGATSTLPSNYADILYTTYTSSVTEGQVYTYNESRYVYSTSNGLFTVTSGFAESVRPQAPSGLLMPFYGTGVDLDRVGSIVTVSPQITGIVTHYLTLVAVSCTKRDFGDYTPVPNSPDVEASCVPPSSLPATVTLATSFYDIATTFSGATSHYSCGIASPLEMPTECTQRYEGNLLMTVTLDSGQISTVTLNSTPSVTNIGADGDSFGFVPITGGLEKLSGFTTSTAPPINASAGASASLGAASRRYVDTSVERGVGVGVFAALWMAFRVWWC